MITEMVKLINAIGANTQLLMVLSNDPQVPADQKDIIKDRIKQNQGLVLEVSAEREVRA